MLRPCPRCHQFYKVNETTCPHCGSESRWKKAVIGVAAAAVLGAGCDKPPVPVPAYGMPPRPEPVDAGNMPKPLYGLPPREAPPPAPPDADKPAPPPHPVPRPLYGIPPPAPLPPKK